MKPFIFKLQTALDIKLKEEDRQKEELYAATEVYKRNLEVLEDLRYRRAEIQDILRGQQSGEMDICEIQQCQDFILVLNDRIKKQQETTEISRQEMERVRSRLIEIMRDRKVLEKLRAKQHQEYMCEYLRQEQKQIDEMAMIGYSRKDSAV